MPLKIVEYLVQQGVDINARPECPIKIFSLSRNRKPTNEKTCLYIAAEKCHFDLVKYLIEKEQTLMQNQKIKLHCTLLTKNLIWKYFIISFYREQILRKKIIKPNCAIESRKKPAT
jgi:hypothetical protein